MTVTYETSGGGKHRARRPRARRRQPPPATDDLGLDAAGIEINDVAPSPSTSTCARASAASTRSATSTAAAVHVRLLTTTAWSPTAGRRLAHGRGPRHPTTTFIDPPLSVGLGSADHRRRLLFCVDSQELINTVAVAIARLRPRLGHHHRRHSRCSTRCSNRARIGAITSRRPSLSPPQVLPSLPLGKPICCHTSYAATAATWTGSCCAGVMGCGSIRPRVASASSDNPVGSGPNSSTSPGR